MPVLAVIPFVLLAQALPARQGSGLQAPGSGSLVSKGPSDAAIAEAQAFMASSASDLVSGNREALWQRYDPRGWTFVGAGVKQAMTTEATKERYLKRWNPPLSFAWKNLDYEALGPDAVVVTGLFEWAREGGVTTASYTALLLKREGRWVIRIENESAAPKPSGN